MQSVQAAPAKGIVTGMQVIHHQEPAPSPHVAFGSRTAITLQERRQKEIAGCLLLYG